MLSARFFFIFFDRLPPKNPLLPSQKILFFYPKKLLFSQYVIDLSLLSLKNNLLEIGLKNIFFTMPKKCPCQV